MKILYAAAEAIPFAATGGLADVAGSLPRALNAGNCVCRAVMPLYGDIPQELRAGMKLIAEFSVRIGWRNQYCGVHMLKLPPEGGDGAGGRGLIYYFIDNEYYFKRPGLYGHHDDAERFAFFSRAVIEMTEHIGYVPDIMHINDWHTAPVAALLDERSPIRTVLTVHNVQYQGVFGMDICGDILGVPEEKYPTFEHNGRLNFLKAGLVSADAVTTVSPTYAQELTDPYYAYGLEPVFAELAAGGAGRLTGILNGIDTGVYDPATDNDIFARYDASDMSGKAANRRSLQQLLGLQRDDGAFIIGTVSRLVETKGFELIRGAMENILGRHIQFVVLGKGDWAYENYFTSLMSRFPGKISANIGFINDLAHKIYAGADAFLMPSRIEPCGLSQMIAMRYGTVPIVHETGGLKDSVTDCGGDVAGNGFTFKSFRAEDLIDAVSRAEAVFRDRARWDRVVASAMRYDSGWARSAASYRKVYRLTGK